MNKFQILLCALLFFAEIAALDTYEFYLSEGNNLMDRDRIDEAVWHFKKAIKEKPHEPDAYLQLGHLHLRESLPKIALEYLKQAEKHAKKFQHPRSEVELYMTMAATYNSLRLMRQEIYYLQRIIGLGQDKEGDFYRQYSGKAHFLLGLIAKKNSEPIESNEAFRKAIAFKFWQKTCYLYLAHFYAIHDQAQIDAFLKGKFSKALKTEHRNRYFKFYFEKYLSIPAEEEDERGYLDQDLLIKLEEAVRQYANQLSIHPGSSQEGE